jgi:hypothetical protein
MCRLRYQAAIGDCRLLFVIQRNGRCSGEGRQDVRPLFLSSYTGTAIELYSLFTSLEVS